MNLIFSNDKKVKIKNLLNIKKFPVNLDYQREPEAWTKEDEQYFIDSILKKIKIPKSEYERLMSEGKIRE